MFKEIFSLVGKQPMPVLIPILQYNPEKAWLIPSTETVEKARCIRDATRLYGKCQCLPRQAREPVSAYCCDATCEAIDSLLQLAVQKEEINPSQIAINITGGTSIMALSAARAASKLRLPMLYVNTDENMIHHLTPDGNLDHKEDITVRIHAEVYFKAHGINFGPGEWGKAVKEDRPWTRSFIEIARELGRAGSQSAPLMDAIRRAYQPGDPYAVIPFSEARLDLANMLLQKGMLDRVDNSDDKLILMLIEQDSQEGKLKRKFLEGDWLELFVYGELRDSGLFDDVLYDVQVSRLVGKAKVSNQFDAVVMRRSRFAAVSCKSEPMDRQEKRGALYELDSLLQADLMGLYAVKMLVTNQPEFSKDQRGRADLSGINLITGKQFPDIVDKVEEALKKTIR